MGGIGDDMPVRKARDPPFGLRAVGAMARCDREPERHAGRIDRGRDPGRQPTAAPPFCEVASAWTFETLRRLTRTHGVRPLRSISAHSKPGSAIDSLKRRSQAPARDQRRNRVWTAFQCPGSSGRSRQGEAPRASRGTAPMNSRLPAPLRPRSPALPGNSGASRSPCPSARVRLPQDRLRFRSGSRTHATSEASDQDAVQALPARCRSSCSSAAMVAS